MNTTAGRMPILPRIGKNNYVFLLDDLELAINKDQLEVITEDWNSGMQVVWIAKRHKRLPIEIMLALIHQARQKGKKLKRPIPRDWYT